MQQESFPLPGLGFKLSQTQTPEVRATVRPSRKHLSRPPQRRTSLMARRSRTPRSSTRLSLSLSHVLRESLLPRFILLLLPFDQQRHAASPMAPMRYLSLTADPVAVRHRWQSFDKRMPSLLHQKSLLFPRQKLQLRPKRVSRPRRLREARGISRSKSG